MKFVLDSLNKRVYIDDCQVVSLITKKLFTDHQARVEITVRLVEEPVDYKEDFKEDFKTEAREEDKSQERKKRKPRSKKPVKAEDEESSENFDF